MSAAAKRELWKQQLKRDQAHLLCDIREGKLVFAGHDPLCSVQDEGLASDRTSSNGTSVATSRGGALAGPQAVHGTLPLRCQACQALVSVPGGHRHTATNAAAFAGQRDLVPASRVLNLAIGLLGMDVHEAPNPWAEAWLTFEDNTMNSLGLGGRRDDSEVETPRSVKSVEGKAELIEWQGRVLSHLQNLVAAGLVQPPPEDEEDIAALGKKKVSCSFPIMLGPEFAEHLDLAEFVLKRISHAVNTLQDPETLDRPMVLREYTEKMVAQVAKDLRQWLEALSNLISIYHVHLLDLEKERRRLACLLDSRQARYVEGAEQKRQAVARYEKLADIRREERMRQRAETILGLPLNSEDAKIYSQKDVDEMYKAWEKEFVDPLNADIAELRATRDELLAKLGKKPSVEARLSVKEPALSPQVLASCLAAIGSRCHQEELTDMLQQLGAAVESGSDLSEILRSIQRLPITSSVGKPAGGEPAAPGEDEAFGEVAAELTKLEAALKDYPGFESISALIGWGHETVSAAMADRRYEARPPPSWEVPTELKRLSVARAKTSVNSGGGRGLGAGAGAAGADAEEEGPAADGDPVGQCIGAVLVEIGKLARGLKGLAGGEKASGLLDWARDTLGALKLSRDATKWKAPPAWDLHGIGGPGGPGVNVADLEAMWQARLDKLRRDLEEKLRKAVEALEKEKEKTADALRRLAEATKKAELMINELRRKLLDMQQILDRAGLGKQAQDALWESGLAEFLNGRDVFERLYRDAIRRMQRYAEAQVRMLEETSAEFCRNMQALYAPLVWPNGEPVLVLPNAAEPRPSGGSVFRGPTRSSLNGAIAGLYRLDGLAALGTAMSRPSSREDRRGSSSLSPGLRVIHLAPKPDRCAATLSTATGGPEGEAPAASTGGFSTRPSRGAGSREHSPDFALAVRGLGYGSDSRPLSRERASDSSHSPPPPQMQLLQEAQVQQRLQHLHVQELPPPQVQPQPQQRPAHRPTSHPHLGGAARRASGDSGQAYPAAGGGGGGGMLPLLECRGRPVLAAGGAPQGVATTAAAADGCSRATALGGRPASTAVAAGAAAGGVVSRGPAGRSRSPEPADDGQALLHISGLTVAAPSGHRPSGSGSRGGGSLLLPPPPPPAEGPPAPPYAARCGTALGIKASKAGPGSLVSPPAPRAAGGRLRTGGTGSNSMPQLLGPPRLLVQTVGLGPGAH